MTFHIEDVERSGARLVIGLAGTSGSGKTYTAMQLAWGLANGNAQKVGFLDTENGRGKLYADKLKDKQGRVHRFKYASMGGPFTPERFVEGIEAFEKIGVEVLVIDSFSHEYDGDGGLQDIAAKGARQGMDDWRGSKARHKALMRKLLTCDMHIIVCLRAQEKVRFEKDEKGRTVIVPMGLTPICEKNFMFELTASLLMYNEGREQTRLKCPEDLHSILGRESGYISAKDGAELRKWVDGKNADADRERVLNGLRTIAVRGLQAFEKAWNELPDDQRKKVKEEEWKAIKSEAKAYDAERARTNDAAADKLNAMLRGGTDGPKISEPG